METEVTWRTWGTSVDPAAGCVSRSPCSAQSLWAPFRVLHSVTLHRPELAAYRVPVPWCSSLSVWEAIVLPKGQSAAARHSFVQLPVPQQGVGPGGRGRRRERGKTQTCLCHPGLQSQRQSRAYGETHTHTSWNSKWESAATSFALTYHFISEQNFWCLGGKNWIRVSSQTCCRVKHTHTTAKSLIPQLYWRRCTHAVSFLYHSVVAFPVVIETVI